MFDRVRIGPFAFQGLTFDQLRSNFPWLLAILESHRRQCNPDNSHIRAFTITENDLVCEKCHKPIANWRNDRKSSQSVGVIGFGNFGQFFAKHLSRAFNSVTVTDTFQLNKEAEQLNLSWGSLEEVASKNVIVLAVPLQSLEEVLKEISAFLQPNSLVVDVCSVKEKPLKLMLEHLPTGVDILGTHPLFGPKSAKEGLFGHRIVICPQRVNDKRMDKVQSLLSHGFGMQVLQRDAETHDREMATVQALTHFIARGLTGCSVQKSELTTVAFSKLCEAAELLGGDSWELFETIELGNPFAAEIRARFMKKLNQLQRRLGE